MLGERYLFDTNALVALLKGNPALLSLTERAQWLGVSVINVLEFLGFEDLLDSDKLLFDDFISRVTVVDLCATDSKLIRCIADMRKTRNLKLPDAIIAASAVCHDAVLVTNDAVLHKLVASNSGLKVANFLDH